MRYEATINVLKYFITLHSSKYKTDAAPAAQALACARQHAYLAQRHENATTAKRELRSSNLYTAFAPHDSKRVNVENHSRAQQPTQFLCANGVPV
jgi:hypothetical protein